MTALYDRLGRTYTATRRADPRIAAAIREALGDARKVVNVGAGTGAYEPTDRDVVAVDPSAVMLAQRPPGAARAIRGAAESLPFADDSFDAALAVLTVHHWSDLAAGLAELRRVARRVVVLHWDSEVTARFWLVREYLPEIAVWEAAQAPPLQALADALGGERGPAADVRPVPVPHDCTDGFLGAFWRRPEAYLDPTVRAGMSSLTALADRAGPGLQRLADDLANGAWQARHAELLDLCELDVGYRLLVTRGSG
jgi:SAM-dependent methyltransferase